MRVTFRSVPPVKNGKRSGGVSSREHLFVCRRAGSRNCAQLVGYSCRALNRR